ncbi:phosphatase PAP2 family protein [Siminovitchia acidinfaciens]|uniref:Phosphatase PAP2 family protein n=1 Tax=Siminovitchia acidinfaciens TaxID=2321395 RepID=A0A429XX19_9BACI|nr:phosphatase PAP2 family protein [Siminovitchia acidinfaciens]RST73047.1 phosphatase PAP2 family protein [Siminovitchia acidinfaciens]
MVNESHHTKTLIIALISFLLFYMMVILVKGKKVETFDQSIIHLIQGLESPLLTNIMKFFTFIGSFPIVMLIFVLVSFVLLYIFKHRFKLLLFGIVLLGTPIINELLKLSFHRVRPNLHRLIEIGGYSFPSGHAMNAFAVYGILIYLLWNNVPGRIGRIVLIITGSFFIVMIGTSRIYLGVHYPSDVIAGYFASCCWLSIVIGLFQYFGKRH